MDSFSPKHAETVSLCEQLFTNGLAEKVVFQLIEDSLGFFCEDGKLDVRLLAEIDAYSFQYAIGSSTAEPGGSDGPEYPYVSFVKRLTEAIWHPLADPNDDEDCLKDFFTAMEDEFVFDPTQEDDWLAELAKFDEDMVMAINQVFNGQSDDDRKSLTDITLMVWLKLTEDRPAPSGAQTANRGLVLHAVDYIVHWYKIWNGFVSGFYGDYVPETVTPASGA